MKYMRISVHVTRITRRFWAFEPVYFIVEEKLTKKRDKKI